MTTSSSIPEIRVYSPSDHGDSNDHINDQETVSSSVIRMRPKKTSATGDNNNNNTSDKKEGVKKVSWENTFHMRNMNLMNFGGQATITCRSTHRSQSMSLHRARMGCTTSSAKSLNILRQALQHSINKEINDVLQKYLDKFFRPAIENIRNNIGSNAVSEQHIQVVCRQLLEEAKKMYYGGIFTRSNSPMNAFIQNADNLSDNENNPVTECRIGHKRRAKDSDSDSETSSQNTLRPIVPRKKKVISHKPSPHNNSNNERLTPIKLHSSVAKLSHTEGIKREGPKWDPSRLSVDTKFVLGSRANKALGFGTTRGRLYTKHADLFRYIGDQEDKQWLHDNHLMPPAGGRAYLLIKEDILDLIKSEEYRNAPGVNPNDMGEGFTVPEYMIVKMANVMHNMRNSDVARKKIENRSRLAFVASQTPSGTPTGCENNSASSGLDSRDTSNQASVETNRPSSGQISPADEMELNPTEMTSGHPSPFNINAACFECDVSPVANQQISVIESNTIDNIVI